MRTKLLAVLSVAVLTACGGGSEKTAGDTAGDAKGAKESGRTLTEAELKSALLTLKDLPTGFKAGDVGPDEPEESLAPDAGECEKLFEELGDTFDSDAGPKEQEASFESTELGTSLEQSVDSFESSATVQKRLKQFGDNVAKCPKFTVSSDGEDAEITMKALSFPEMGDEADAYSLSGKISGFPFVANVVIVRVDRSLTLIVHSGLGGVDSKVTEQISRAAADKLQRVAA